MQIYLKNYLNKKLLLTFPLLLAFIPFYSNPAKSGIEFQWDNKSGYKKLKWHQKNAKKRGKNQIFFFYRPSDRKTGLLKINIKVPDSFKSAIKPKKVTLCRVNIGGFDSKTKCIENIAADIEINNKGKNVEIYPLAPLPSDKEAYAVVFKVTNPQRAGLYQFNSFGKSSGTIPVSSYLGSWTVKIDQQ